jgi:hypothetical protein
MSNLTSPRSGYEGLVAEGGFARRAVTACLGYRSTLRLRSEHEALCVAQLVNPKNAGASREAGKCEAIVTVEGGLGRLNLKQPSVTDAATTLGLSTWWKARGYTATVRESALTAEGSTRNRPGGTMGGFSRQPASMRERLAHETGHA